MSKTQIMIHASAKRNVSVEGEDRKTGELPGDGSISDIRPIQETGAQH